MHFDAEHLLVGIQGHGLYRIRYSRLEHADVSSWEHHAWSERVREVSEPLQDSLAITADSEHPSNAPSRHTQPQTTFKSAAQPIEPATPHGKHQQAYGYQGC